MSWLSRLIGSTPQADIKPELPRPAKQARIELDDYGSRIVHIRAIDMMGQSAKSPNGRFVLVWQGGNLSDDGKGRAGRYVLIEDGMLVVDGAMERPQDGLVTDRGVFVLNDWSWRGDLCGTFHAFRPDGSEIIARDFTANLYNNGLSPDGRLAVCQTCNAPGSPDSSILAVFDLVEGREIAEWSAESGWAEGYEFPVGGQRIRMLRRDRAAIDYSLQGEFIDRRKWYSDEVARGTFHVLKKALEAGEEVTGLSLRDLRRGAIAALADSDDRFRADVLRLAGEIEEQAGDDRAALAHYEAALVANPKVGVAKRAAALRGALAR